MCQGRRNGTGTAQERGQSQSERASARVRERKRDRQTGRQADRQAGRQAERQTDGRTDRQTQTWVARRQLDEACLQPIELHHAGLVAQPVALEHTERPTAAVASVWRAVLRLQFVVLVMPLEPAEPQPQAQSERGVGEGGRGCCSDLSASELASWHAAQSKLLVAPRDQAM